LEVNDVEKEYTEVDGTFYDSRTPLAVARILERFRINRMRLKIHHGDSETGLAWGDSESGRIGRSTGPVKIPLLVKNSRSMGGGAILDHCIVKIEYANKKNGGTLYQHPKYHEEEGA
jgi:hypothetical protein